MRKDAQNPRRSLHAERGALEAVWPVAARVACGSPCRVAPLPSDRLTGSKGSAQAALQWGVAGRRAEHPSCSLPSSCWLPWGWGGGTTSL